MLDARKADLPERSRQALELLVGQTKRFHQMVLDLLEISRLDAGAADLHTEPVLLDQFVSRVASRYGYAHVPVITEVHMAAATRRRSIGDVLNGRSPICWAMPRTTPGGPVQITLSGASSNVVTSFTWELKMPGLAWPRLNVIGFSRGSHVARRLDTAPEPDWGWHWCTSTFIFRADECGWRTDPTVPVPDSLSSFPQRRNRCADSLSCVALLAFAGCGTTTTSDSKGFQPIASKEVDVAFRETPTTTTTVAPPDRLQQRSPTTLPPTTLPPTTVPSEDVFLYFITAPKAS